MGIADKVETEKNIIEKIYLNQKKKKTQIHR